MESARRERWFLQQAPIAFHQTDPWRLLTGLPLRYLRLAVIDAVVAVAIPVPACATFARLEKDITICHLPKKPTTKDYLLQLLRSEASWPPPKQNLEEADS